MRRVALLMLLAALGSACATGPLYEKTRPSADEFDGARSVCEAYHDPPWYYFCSVLDRQTCREWQRAFDYCMEQRGWRRIH
jgi:hypothetical protein